LTQEGYKLPHELSKKEIEAYSLMDKMLPGAQSTKAPPLVDEVFGTIESRKKEEKILEPIMKEALAEIQRKKNNKAKRLYAFNMKKDKAVRGPIDKIINVTNAMKRKKAHRTFVEQKKD